MSTIIKVIGTSLLLEASLLSMDLNYDPFTISDVKIEKLELSFHDTKRDRTIPVRIYLPTEKKPAPVILFSHGLGGSKKSCSYLAEHWAQRGYLCAFIQHQGSDESIWKNKSTLNAIVSTMRSASKENFVLRAEDIPAVIDRLDQWNKTNSHPLLGRMDMNRLGMGGHSFGALTAQAVSGELVDGYSFTEPRIKAALISSPSSLFGDDPEKRFKNVQIPWFLINGSRDTMWWLGPYLNPHLKVFGMLSGAPKYEVILYNAEHSAIHQKPLPWDRLERNPNHHRSIIALSTAFWDTYLGGNVLARSWLDGDGPRLILEQKDQWNVNHNVGGHSNFKSVNYQANLNR